MPNKSVYNLVIEDEKGNKEILFADKTNILLEDIDNITSGYKSANEFLTDYHKAIGLNINPARIFITKKYRSQIKRYDCIFDNPNIEEISTLFKNNNNDITNLQTPKIILSLLNELFDLINIGEVNHSILLKMPYIIRNRVEELLRQNHFVTSGVFYKESIEIRNEILAEMKKSYKNYRGMEMIFSKLRLRKEQEEYHQQTFAEYFKSSKKNDDKIEDYSAKEAYYLYNGDVDSIIASLGEDKILSLSEHDRYLIGITKNDIKRISGRKR